MTFRKPSRSLWGRVRRHRCSSFVADHCRDGRRAMSELTAPVARPGIPGLIGSWPQSRFWLLCVDLYPALAAASLPWSTTAVSVFMVLWLLVVLPTIRWQAFFESLRAPASFLPLAFFALAIAGLFWTADSWPVGFQGLLPVKSCWPFRFSFITTNAPSAGIGCCSRSWLPVSCSWDCHG